MRTLTIGSQILRIETLGQPIDGAFDELYIACLSTNAPDEQRFEQAAIAFFDTRPGPTGHDNYFNNFTILWQRLLAVRNFDEAEQIWDLALRPALVWETKRGDRIHKGSPYYYWGITSILRGDLDKGYCLVHQAVEEDRATNGTPNYRDLPGFALVSLKYDKVDQLFRSWVLAQATMITDRINRYNAAYHRRLTVGDLSRRFLQSPPDDDAVFLFAYVAARVMKLALVPRHALENGFAGQLEINILFDLTLVIDAAIKNKSPGKWKFIDLTASLLAAAGQPLSAAQLGEINGSFNAAFDATVSALLNGTYALPSGPAIGRFQSDAAVAYGLRNRWAHDVTTSTVIWSRFPEIQQALFNALFGVLDHLY
jgi:hypothetical protein